MITFIFLEQKEYKTEKLKQTHTHTHTCTSAHTRKIPYRYEPLASFYILTRIRVGSTVKHVLTCD